MGLTRLLVRAAAARPRVLLVTTPGGTAVRLAAERELRCRDWPTAATPAGADLMLVAGPGYRERCQELGPALDRLWEDTPRPRVRLRAETAEDVAAALDAGRARLGATEHAHSGAGRTGRTHGQGGGFGRTHGQGGDSGRTHGQGEGSGRTREAGGVRRTSADGERRAPVGGDTDGGMEMPGGLPMAEVGEDRDGLALDRLHVSLGPFLADWPSGLIVHLVLQGDVVQRARLGGPCGGGTTEPFWARPWARAAEGEPVPLAEAARRRAAAHLDSLGRLLAVAGWPAEAVTARRIRDDLLERAPVEAVLPRALRLQRRVGRSRTLDRLTRGIGTLSTADARAAGVSGPAARAGGDVPARYRRWLADAVDDVRRLDGRALLGPTAPDPEALTDAVAPPVPTALLDPTAQESPRGRWDAERPPSVALAGLLPRLLEGAELAAARLVVAGLDPDPDELAAPTREFAGG
ncbi:hypothetical protein [Streptomyces halstedii]|uniref:hypothetical protein n=1 Tax=Streptomyces halstedii TaxID=1944 RepID=UPI00365771B4